MKRLLTILLFMTVVFLEKSFSQDPAFSLFSNNPQYYNPATVSISDGMQVSMNYRNQWSGLPGTFQTFIFSTKATLCKPENPKLGIGFFALTDIEGEPFLKTSYYGFSLGSSFRGKHLSGGIGMSFIIVDKSIDWSKLEFSDQLDKLYGNVYQTRFPFPDYDLKPFPDISWGGIIRYSPDKKASSYSSFSNLGFAGHHFFNPVQSLLNSSSMLNKKFVLHTNYVSKTNKINKKSYTVGLIYEQQNPLSTLTFGFNGMYQVVYGGLWFRTKISQLNKYDCIIFTFGLVNRSKYNYIWKLGYSYDLTVSRLLGGGFGSHELYFSIDFDKCLPLLSKSKLPGHSKRGLIECPPGFEF